MARKAIFLGGVVCVVALVLLVWWSGGEREKGGPPGAGKQGTVTPRRESRSAFGEWMRSWILPGQESQSAGWEPKDVEETVRKTFLAYNRKDLRAFKAGWTEKGFQQAYRLPKEKATDFGLLSLLSFRPYTIGEFSDTSVEAETAATEVRLTYAEVYETHRLSLVRDNDVWKIDHDEKLSQPPPNATVVDVKLQYFNILLDRNRAARGSVAFNITNTDTRPHEFILKRIAESESEETTGMTKPLKPGENETLVLNLTPGRYVALCNMVSRDGVPYSSGMRTEFLIQ